MIADNLIQLVIAILASTASIWISYWFLKKPITQKIQKNSLETIVRSNKSESLFNFVKCLRILIHFEEEQTKEIQIRKFTYLRYSVKAITDFVYGINWKQDNAQFRMLNLIGIMEDENRALNDCVLDDKSIKRRIDNAKKIKTEIEELILKWINQIIKHYHLDIILIEESILRQTEADLRNKTFPNKKGSEPNSIDEQLKSQKTQPL